MTAAFKLLTDSVTIRKKHHVIFVLKVRSGKKWLYRCTLHTVGIDEVVSVNTDQSGWSAGHLSGHFQVDTQAEADATERQIYVYHARAVKSKV